MADINYQSKVIKGFIRYESGVYNFNSEKVVQDKQSVDMPEDLAGAYLNIVVLYGWYMQNSNQYCKIKIGWELANADGTKFSGPLSYNFGQKKVTIKINGEEKTLSDDKKTLDCCSVLNEDNTQVLIDDGTFAYTGDILVQPNTKAITIDFLYYNDSLYTPLNVINSSDFYSKITLLKNKFNTSDPSDENFWLASYNSRYNSPERITFSTEYTYDENIDYYYTAAPLVKGRGITITENNFNDYKDVIGYFNGSTFVTAKDEGDYNAEKKDYYRFRIETISKIDVTGNKAIKIQKPSKYEHNVIFNEAGLNELIGNIKKYPVIDIVATPEGEWVDGQPSITITHGDSSKNAKVAVGSNIKFINPSDNTDITTPASGSQATGTFRVKLNSTTYEVPIKGLAGGTGAINFSGNLLPSDDATYTLGSPSKHWKSLYLSTSVNTGDSEGLLTATYTNKLYNNTTEEYDIAGKTYGNQSIICAIGTEATANSSGNDASYSFGGYGTTCITSGESGPKTIKNKQYYGNENIYLLSDNTIHLIPGGGFNRDDINTNVGWPSGLDYMMPRVLITYINDRTLLSNDSYPNKTEAFNSGLAIQKLDNNNEWVTISSTERAAPSNNTNYYALSRKAWVTVDGVTVNQQRNGGFMILRNSSTSSNNGIPFIKGYSNEDTESNLMAGAIYFGGNDCGASRTSCLGRIATYINANNSNDGNGKKTTLEINAMENTANSDNYTNIKLVYDKDLTENNPSAFDDYKKRIFMNGVLKASKVFNAVFNDYAEYRTTINLEAGRVVIDNDDGSLSCSSMRLQPGAQVISDTFGQSMGETDTAKTPLAVAGRVLVYPYQSRENYHAGMAVCSAPDGTVDIMTREEIRDYPDCIVGIVSEIPQYETWGSDNVAVNGRIWIKVK